jgi:cytoskeletal protein CcmA (bactofilin family)
MFNTAKNRTQEVAVTPSASSSAALNMIAAGTVIEGEIKSSGDLRIDGTVKGSVLSKAKVVVGVTGLIEGDVFAQNADISGAVRGKTTVSETTFLKNSAKVHGDIITSKLVVEVGASFTGNCNMGATVKELNIGDKPAEKQQLKEKSA